MTSKETLKNFETRYDTVYVFILESKKSLKCVGWGNKRKFVSKYGDYKIYESHNSHADKTTELILVED